MFTFPLAEKIACEAPFPSKKNFQSGEQFWPAFTAIYTAFLEDLFLSQKILEFFIFDLFLWTNITKITNGL